MELIINKINQYNNLEDVEEKPIRKLLTPLSVRNAQKRYFMKPDIKEKMREYFKLRERKRKLDPEYRILANQRSYECIKRKKERLLAEKNKLKNEL